MSKVQTATCQDCGWHGPVEETKELRNVWDRVQPGDVMPAGECPEEGCAGAAMLDRSDAADDLRPAIVALIHGLDRLHDTVRPDTHTASVAGQLGELADYARKALAAGALPQPVCNTCGGTRVRVDAWACWDLQAQRWALHSTFEALAIFVDCDAECSYTMRRVAATG